MTRVEASSHEDSHAILVGVSAFEDSEFPSIPAARNSVEEMRLLLSDPALCGWSAEQITVILNPSTRVELARRIADIAEETRGTLLIYYVGHGVLDRRGKLCLTVTSTSASRPQIDGLPWEAVADILDNTSCPAKVRIAILDCCFAGQAIEALAASEGSGLADITHIEGVYTLTATTRNRTAHVPPRGREKVELTSFTAEFCELIREGISGRSAWLTFSDVYPFLRQRLIAKNLPAPNQRGIDTADKYPFSANAAYRDGSTNGRSFKAAIPSGNAKQESSSSASSGRANLLIQKAIRAAYSAREDAERSQALAEIAQVLYREDPTRAKKLFKDARAVAEAIDDYGARAWSLLKIVKAYAKLNDAEVESLVSDFHPYVSEDPQYSIDVMQFASMARALVRISPEQAGEVHRAIDYDRWKSHALKGISAINVDIKMPNQSASRIEYGSSKARALAEIAQAAGKLVPAKENGIVLRFSGTALHIWVMIKMARAIADFNEDESARLFGEAERLGRIAVQGYERDWLRAELVRTIADIDPDSANRIASEISSKALEVWTLVAFDRMSIQARPSHFKQLQPHALARSHALDLMEDKPFLADAFVEVVKLLDQLDLNNDMRFRPMIADLKHDWPAQIQAGVVAILAPIDLERAQAVSSTILRPVWRAQAQAAVAKALTSVDQDAAENMAMSIADDAWRARALVSIVETS